MSVFRMCCLFRKLTFVFCYCLERDRHKPAPPPKPMSLSPGQYEGRSIYRGNYFIIIYFIINYFIIYNITINNFRSVENTSLDIFFPLMQNCWRAVFLSVVMLISREMKYPCNMNHIRTCSCRLGYFGPCSC